MIEFAEKPRPPYDGLATGVLIEHGRANLEFRPDAPHSYYVKLQTEWGERTIWGSGLERAFARSRTHPKPGEPIGVRENGTAPLQFRRKEPDEVEVLLAAKTPPPRPRTQWVVERLEFFDERAMAAQTLRDPRISARQAVTNHPELTALYLILSRTIDTVRERYRLPAERSKVVAIVREAMARTAEMGDPLPQSRERDRHLILEEIKAREHTPRLR